MQPNYLQIMEIFTVEYLWKTGGIRPHECQIGQGGSGDQTITLA